MPKPNLTRKYDPKCLLVAKKTREVEATIKQLRYAFNAYYYGGLKLWWGLRKMEIKAEHYESGAYQDYQICKGKYSGSEWIPATYDEERRFAEVWKPEWEDFIKMYWESFGNGIIPLPEVEVELLTEINVSGKSEIDLLLERTKEILEFFAEEFSDLLVNKRCRIPVEEQVKEALRAWNRKEKEDVAEAIDEIVSLQHAETLMSKRYIPDPDLDEANDEGDESEDLDIAVKAPTASNGIELVRVIRQQTEQLTEAEATARLVKVASHPEATDNTGTLGRSKKSNTKNAGTPGRKSRQQQEAEAFLKEHNIDPDGEIDGVQVTNKTKKPTGGVSELNSLVTDKIPF